MGRRKGWPDQWKKGEIIPILKIGNGERVENYRGVTLMPSSYKVYATILADRLREDVEEREGILPGNPAGFRKGMGTMDQIYSLNYLINRQLGRDKRMIALFIDLKAAFDSINRRVFVGVMRQRGVREGLVDRVEEILRETKCRVRIREQWGEEFWTAGGMRQGYPLTPMLFNLIIADIEEYMEKGRWGGLKLKERKIYTLMYPYDIAVMVEDEYGIKALIGY